MAHYPAYNVTLLHLGSLNAGRALYESGGAAWMNPAKVTLITDAVYAKCDGLDGVKDGIIGQIKACNSAFDVKTLRSPTAMTRAMRALSDATAGGGTRIIPTTSPGCDRGHGHVPQMAAARRRTVP